MLGILGNANYIVYTLFGDKLHQLEIVYVQP